MLSVLASAVLVRPLSSSWARILKNEGFFAVALAPARVMSCLRVLSSWSAACMDLSFVEVRPGSISARDITMLDECSAILKRSPEKPGRPGPWARPEEWAFAGKLCAWLAIAHARLQANTGRRQRARTSGASSYVCLFRFYSGGLHHPSVFIEVGADRRRKLISIQPKRI